MVTERIHRTTSADGTPIAGRVRGQGPPLVLVHGALYDGDSAWAEVLPHLVDRFTCFLPSTRGKGLSGTSEDITLPRMLDDLTAFVGSIGDAVPVVGWSGGGTLALGAAARTTAVSHVVAYEPGVFEALDERGRARIAATVARMQAEAAAGRPLEAARAFLAMVANEEEQEAVVASGRLELAAPNIPTELRMLSQLPAASGPAPTDPALLARITVPVLLLRGDRSAWSWFDDGIDHVAEHVTDCQVRTVPGAGHSAPGLLPGAVAAEVVRFLQAARQPA